MSNPIEIYNEDFTNQSTITITGLDGNKHKEYIIKIDGQAALTSDAYLTSSLSDNWVGQLIKNKTGTDPGADTGITGSSQPLLSGNIVGGGEIHYINSTTKLKTRSGKKRWCITELDHRETTFIGFTRIGCMHNTDTTTNITSIVLHFPGGFTGNIIVEKNPGNTF